MLGQQVRSARHGMTHYHHVNAHRFDVLGRIDERLALGDAGPDRSKIVRVRTEALGREGEARPRAGRRLKEEIDDDFAFEITAFLTLSLADFIELLGGVENGLDLSAAQLFQSEK